MAMRLKEAEPSMSQDVNSQSRLLPDGQDIRVPWHLRLPAQLERDFTHYLMADSGRIIHASMSIVMLLLLCGTAVEYLVDDRNVLMTWRPRLLSVFAAIPAWWLSRQADTPPGLQASVVLFAFVLGGTNNYCGTVIAHPLAWSYYLVNILAILLMSTLFRITLYWALAASAALVIMLAITLIGFSRLAPAEALVVFFMVFSAAVLSLTGHYFFERLQRRHFLIERVLSMHRSELFSANMALESKVTEDPLTGTVNRRGMEARLNKLIQEWQHGKRDQSLFLIIFDIDFFKQYNDTYGHPAGDECLRKIADVPNSLVQSEQDFVARYGGEEFVVVLSGIQQNDALVFAERMRSRIEKLDIEHKASRVSSVVTISIGVAGMGSCVENAGQLVKRADEALYHAKGQGRNQVVFIDDQNALRSL